MFTQHPTDLERADGPGDEAARTIQPLVDAVRRGQRAGQFADAPAERIACAAGESRTASCRWS